MPPTRLEEARHLFLPKVCGADPEPRVPTHFFIRRGLFPRTCSGSTVLSNCTVTVGNDARGKDAKTSSTLKISHTPLLLSVRKFSPVACHPRRNRRTATVRAPPPTRRSSKVTVRMPRPLGRTDSAQGAVRESRWSRVTSFGVRAMPSVVVALWFPTSVCASAPSRSRRMLSHARSPPPPPCALL